MRNFKNKFGNSLEQINKVQNAKKKAFKSKKSVNEIVHRVNDFEKKLMRVRYFEKDIPDKMAYLKTQFLERTIDFESGSLWYGPEGFSGNYIFTGKKITTAFAKYCEELYLELEKEYPEYFL